MYHQYPESQKVGLKAEEEFAEAARRNGYGVRKSSLEENKFKHIDLWIDADNKLLSVDVKAKKKVARSSSQLEDRWMLVEFKNVAGGLGWLHGEADWIAQRVDGGFLITGRESLLELCSGLVDNKISPYPDSTRGESKELYRRYSRTPWGKKDEFGYILSSDIPENTKDFRLWEMEETECEDPFGF
jgi:hypothetical protein